VLNALLLAGSLLPLAAMFVALFAVARLRQNRAPARLREGEAGPTSATLARRGAP